MRRAQPLFSTVQSRLDALNTRLQENLAGMRVVKAFVRADYEQGRFDTANLDLMQRTVQAIRVMAVVMPLMTLVLNCGVAGALWLGGVHVIRGDMQLGQIIAFINYLLWSALACGA
jgi:ATP-binding cassette, subfamily B, multidrug efflux pump